MNSSIRCGIALLIVAMVAWLARQPAGSSGQLGAAQRQFAASTRDEAPQSDSVSQGSLCEEPAAAAPLEYNPELIKPLVDEAKANGNSRQGALLFTSPRFACISCHRI